MKKQVKNEAAECPFECPCTNMVAEEKKPQRAKKPKKELSTEEKIYKFLDGAEKVAIFLAERQKSKKKKAKKQLKKDKKIGKLDKKSGALKLKKVKKDKVQKPMKRYKPPKKKK